MQVVVKPLVLEEWCSSSGGGFGGKGRVKQALTRFYIKRVCWAVVFGLGIKKGWA